MFRFIILLFLILLIRLAVFYNAPKSPSISFQTSPSAPQSATSSIRERISRSFNLVLGKDESALLLGIVIGSKGNFNKEFSSAFKKTGVAHVIAASGMNVSMVSSFLLTVSILLFRRQTALIFSGLAIIFYCALANFEPSIVRAGIMAIFAYGSGILGRQNTSLLALFFTAFLMVFISPGIIEDLGFQLSFLSTAGIILLSPFFKGLSNFFLEDLKTTLSAQIATLPVIFFFFSTYSPISILVNLLVLWTVPPLMILGGFAAFVSIIAPVLSKPFLLLSIPLLIYFKSVVLNMSAFAFEYRFENFPWALIAGYYLILLSVILWGYKKTNN